jgi:UDP-GlcNAc:undecaprenyl-phosphate GlcNAc-1-phosphate transferase
MTLIPFISGLLGLATVLVAVPLVVALCRRAKLERAPEAHHGQAVPVPRLGGLALVAAFFVVLLFAGIVSPAQRSSLLLHPVILVSCLAMFGIGFMDDLKPLGARKKLLAQVMVALAVCACGLGIQLFKMPFSGHIIHLGPWGVLITVLWLVGMTNLINIIDGVDGLAAGIALMLMVLLGYVGHETGNLELLVAGMGGALLGFLCFNFPPARIYMGDGGAYFLGFQIGLFAIVNSHKGEVLAALAAPLFVLALPILDTGLAILRRGLRGLPLFRPDRHHLHHHLLDSGLSRRKVVLAFYSVTLAFLALGMVAYSPRGNMIPVLFGATVLILLLCAGQFKFSRRWFAVGRMIQNSMDMRREIEYALCLSNWLALEGRRGQGVENLWSTLVTAADKLGFASVKLTLADGERAWVREAPSAKREAESAERQAESAERQAPSAERQAPDASRLAPTALRLAPTALRLAPTALRLAPDALRLAPCALRPAPAALRSVKHPLLGGRCGVLELQAPYPEPELDASAAPPGAAATGPISAFCFPLSAFPPSRQRNWARPTITDEGLFDTISELLAEAWVKAAANYINGDNRPLLFSSAPSAKRQAPSATLHAPRSTLYAPRPAPRASRPPQLNPEVGL